MKRTAIILLLTFSIALLPAAGRRAFQLQDLYRLKNISDAHVSPDGSMIVMVVTVSDLAKGKTNDDLFLINTGGTGLHQLTFGEDADNSPRWSPDGRSILFISTRESGPQLWLLPADGGEARRLTKFSSGVAEPLWSPDGKFILFNSEVFPECGADDTCNQRIQDAMDNGPLQARMADKLLYRHWTSYRDGKRTHTFRLELANGQITDLTPGDFDSPPFSLGGVSYTFSPDGKEVCFVSKRVADEASETNSDLFLVPSTGGEPVNITAANTAFDGDPAYSPDGRYIAYRLQLQPRFEADRFRLAVYDRQAKTRRLLTESFDYWINDLAWSADSRWLVFSAAVKGRTPLYRMEAATGKIEEILPPDQAKTLRGYELAADGSLIFLRSGVGEPVELYRRAAGGGEVKRLSAFNQTVAEEVDIRPAEEMWVKGAGGKDIHVFIVKPHNFDPAKKYPLILNVHGGPQMQWSDSFRGDWQVYPGAGYIVAFPNPHGSTGYGQEFTAAISRDWSGRVMEDVLMVTDALAALPYVDADRMGAMGWSWGGYAMMWLEGHTTKFKALAAMMGIYDLRTFWGATEELWFVEWDMGGTPWNSDIYEKQTPSNGVSNFKTPCLVITGERDYRVPYTQSLHFFTDLQRMNVPSRLIVFENDGHWPSGVRSMPFYYNAHLDWFHKYLGGDPAPYGMIKMWRNQAFAVEEKK